MEQKKFIRDVKRVIKGLENRGEPLEKTRELFIKLKTERETLTEKEYNEINDKIKRITHINNILYETRDYLDAILEIYEKGDKDWKVLNPKGKNWNRLHKLKLDKVKKICYNKV